MAYDERGPRGREGSPGVGVATARLTANGELVLQLTTGEEINAGRVKGLDGAKGIDGRDGKDGRDGTDGAPGERGADGLSIKGDAGEPGLPGKHGLSILSGATKPGKRKGRAGEFWIDWTAWRIYGPKTADGWPDGVRLLGPSGPEGPQGPKGDKPKHEWKGTSLRFEKPDGGWGQLVELRGADGLPGRSGGGGGGVSSSTEWEALEW